jgi:pimeloyl-ACP methyl ester carboxylesterase
MSKATVLCIHSYGSSSRQYRGLEARLAPRFHVIAPDLYAHGASPAWQGTRAFTLADEAAAVEALLPQAGPLHVVGHSYGAAVALRIAAAHAGRVRSMALYEPALWGTLAELCPGDAGTLEIQAVRDDTMRLAQAGELAAASERFIDYWVGAGAWAATPEERKPKLMHTLRALPDGWRASFHERWTVPMLRSLDIPCLLLSGRASTAAARRAFRLLRELLPRTAVAQFDGLGHLGPVTHPQLVDPVIESFIGGNFEQLLHAA